MLYRILLFSVKLQNESAIGIHISPPFWTSLLSFTPSHPSRLIQSPYLKINYVLILRWYKFISVCRHVSISSSTNGCFQGYCLLTSPSQVWKRKRGLLVSWLLPISLHCSCQFPGLVSFFRCLSSGQLEFILTGLRFCLMALLELTGI